MRGVWLIINMLSEPNTVFLMEWCVPIKLHICCTLSGRLQLFPYVQGAQTNTITRLNIGQRFRADVGIELDVMPLNDILHMEVAKMYCC